MIEIAEQPKPKVSNRIVDCFGKETYEIPPELRVLDEEKDGDFMELCAKVAEGMAPIDYGRLSCFRIMSQTDGDKRVVWCRRVIAEIKAAKQMFLDLISKGMVPYKVGTDGKASATEMKEFDPIAEEVIFMPVKAIAGG